VGKSRLATECLVDAARAGLPTARAAATRSAAHLPFGAFAGRSTEVNRPALTPPALDVVEVWAGRF
jgi:hypothetical protein